jgi:hypothetical protein
MPSTLNPACPLCGLQYANRPLLELHIREDHPQRNRPSGQTTETITMTATQRPGEPRAPRQPGPRWARATLRRAIARLKSLKDEFIRRPEPASGPVRAPQPGPAPRTATRPAAGRAPRQRRPGRLTGSTGSSQPRQPNPRNGGRTSPPAAPRYPKCPNSMIIPHLFIGSVGIIRTYWYQK